MFVFLNVILPIVAVIVFGVGLPLLVLWLADDDRLLKRRARRNRKRSPKVDIFTDRTVVSYRGAPSVTVQHRIVDREVVDGVVRVQSATVGLKSSERLREWMKPPSNSLTWEARDLQRLRELDTRTARLNRREKALDSREDELHRRAKVQDELCVSLGTRAVQLQKWESKLNLRSEALTQEWLIDHGPRASSRLSFESGREYWLRTGINPSQPGRDDVRYSLSYSAMNRDMGRPERRGERISKEEWAQAVREYRAWLRSNTPKRG